MEKLKDVFFNEEFYSELARKLSSCAPSIDESKFFSACMDGLDEMELKERLHHTTLICREFFPNNYRKALNILYRFSKRVDQNQFGLMFMPDYVAQFGQAEYELSLQALKDFTHLSSSELAIREYLKLNFKKTIKTMEKWTKDDNYHVRRLASEGSRPRLPWATRIDQLINDPTHTENILFLLRKDPEKYVQKSVANHLNDISKDHPGYVVDQVNSWNQDNPNCQWIVKHGMRTLIKQGDKRALKLFGLHQKPGIKLTSILLENKSIKLGEPLTFKIKLKSTKNRPQNLCVDYKIHYKKHSGKMQPKTFKLKTFILDKNSSVTFSKKHLFKNFTTRKHYPGQHRLELLINGESIKTLNFSLQMR